MPPHPPFWVCAPLGSHPMIVVVRMKQTTREMFLLCAHHPDTVPRERWRKTNLPDDPSETSDCHADTSHNEQCENENDKLAKKLTTPVVTISAMTIDRDIFSRMCYSEQDLDFVLNTDSCCFRLFSLYYFVTGPRPRRINCFVRSLSLSLPLSVFI